MKAKRPAMPIATKLIAEYLFIMLPVLWTAVFVGIPPRDRWLLAIRSGIVLVFSIVCVKVGGGLYYESRPFVVQHVSPLVPHVADNGFPSDHAVMCFAITCLIFPFRKRLAALALLFSLLVAASRVAAKLHTPLDMEAGALIAAVSNLAAFVIAKACYTPSTDA